MLMGRRRPDRDGTAGQRHAEAARMRCLFEGPRVKHRPAFRQPTAGFQQGLERGWGGGRYGGRARSERCEGVRKGVSG